MGASDCCFPFVLDLLFFLFFSEFLVDWVWLDDDSCWPAPAVCAKSGAAPAPANPTRTIA